MHLLSRKLRKGRIRYRTKEKRIRGKRMKRILKKTSEKKEIHII